MKTKLRNLILVTGVLCSAGLASAAPAYVAHEWGTFTSVQGADGVQLTWNPLSVSELPKFVYNMSTAGREAEQARLPWLLTKSTAVTLQRMETPVIYFYSDDEVTVRAAVDFPLGGMTEWYPKAELPKGKSGYNMFGPKSLDWPGIKISPNTATESAVGDLGSKLLPMDPSGSHYYAARETDADLLQVGGEREKFLFYRGVANFRAPLTVTQSGDDAESITLQNSGTEELRHLFVYQMTPQGGRFVEVDRLAAGEKRDVAIGQGGELMPSSDVRSRLGQAMASALTREGLYAREAKAMVKTWDTSWYGERGVRVLYTLPGAWTDRTLPLTLEPKPAEIVRVMVGRAELITPRMEWDVMREVVRYSQGAPEEMQRAIAAIRELGLGRFLEPTIHRLTGQMPNRMFAINSNKLLNEASKPGPDGKPLAAK